MTDFEVLVVGSGHAGCEAALAAARMGCRTAVITLNLQRTAHMPCNCSIGGPAKGHLVREIDALGGQMGITIEGTGYPFRIDSIYGTIAVDLEEIQCTSDPLGLLNREVAIRLNNVTATSEVGFTGFVTDSVCTPLIPACARAFNLQLASYGGARLQGDVDCNGCVDDADLLAVLFAFGNTGTNLPEDLNGDGTVDDADLLTVLFAFGSGC